jgi:hypothetical protein
MTRFSIRIKFVAAIVALLLILLYVYCVFFLPFSYDKIKASDVKKIRVRNGLNGYEYGLSSTKYDLLLATLNHSQKEYQCLPVFDKAVMLPDLVFQIEDGVTVHYFRCNSHGPNSVAIVYCNTGVTIYASRLEFENAIAPSD